MINLYYQPVPAKVPANIDIHSPAGSWLEAKGNPYYPQEGVHGTA
jgi:hypothetical protein